MKVLCFLFVFAVSCLPVFGQSLSPLAKEPDWSELNKYQRTITRQEFVDLLDRIYAPNALWQQWIAVTDNQAKIVTRSGQPPFVLQFASSPRTEQPFPQTWRSRKALVQCSMDQPLARLRITLDPGHLGGKWAKMEERWFRVGNVTVKEGDMTLTVAKVLAARLRSLGATVNFTRSRLGPTTSGGPQDFRSVAIFELRKAGIPITRDAVQKKSEELFYRVAEIRHRARLINGRLLEDLTICLHFNAEEWGDEKHTRLSPKNHLHLLVPGCLSTEEFAKDDQRFDILVKLLTRTHTEEIPIARALAKSLARETTLPPYYYKGPNATLITPYVWARNLMANRLFHCPVVYVEAYVMNNAEVVKRIGVGDYKGYRRIPGVGLRKSIYREYADGIVEGLLQYYGKTAVK